MFVLKSTFANGGSEHTIRVDDRYFVVNGDELAKIRAGAHPDDLWGPDEISLEDLA